MKARLPALLVLCGALALGCTAPTGQGEPEVSSGPPIAAKQPKTLEVHGDARIDDYYWLRERDNPAVIAYLEAENEYTETALAHTADLQEQLYEEIVGRIKQDDDSVPYKKDGYFYYQRYREGDEYPLHCRKKGSLEAPEEIMIDANQEAEGHEFFSMWNVEVSPDGKTLAYAIDTVGRRFHTLRFRDLETGKDLPDVLENVTSNGEWANDSKTYLYTKQDPQTLRWSRVYRHLLGTDSAADELVYEETDEEFSVFVFKSRSEKYLMIGANQTLSSEFMYLDADDPSAVVRVIQPREADHEYFADHFGDHFLIKTNWDAENFRLVKTPDSATGKADWTDVIPHRDDVLFQGSEAFADHLVVEERKNGLMQIRIIPWDGSEEHYLDFGEPTYDAWVSDNHEVDTDVLRYAYTSMTTPKSTFDYDMNTREKALLKEHPVLGGFDRADYTTERLWATARDGIEVPISLVYRTELFQRDGSNPALLYAYGSYGASIDASFNSARLSLIDRGFVFAIAHIRGGQELGRQWYEDGKLFNKMNTFNDFIDCGEFLVDQEYTSPNRLFAMGGSAGGLLMGAVTNMAPELFEGIVSHVAWVDVVTTMLDDDIPLTTSEYDEWGDPRQEDDYKYLLSYSPYDNIEAKDYPNILMTTGLEDSQVQYWEPAKYVAKMRALKTDDNLLLLRTNFEAGHGGATGRMKQHRETAQDYAFILDRAGITE